MKKFNDTVYKRLSLVVMLLCALVARAENRVYVNSFTANPGEEVMVNILMDNSDVVNSLQFNLILSDGLSYVPGSMDKVQARIKRSSHQLMTRQIDGYPDGQALCVLVASAGATMDKSVIVGHSGAILSFKVKVGDKFKDGTVSITGVTATHVEGSTVSELSLDDTYAQVSPYVGEASLGAKKFGLRKGETALVPLNLANDVEVVGLQAMVTLPAGVTLDEDEDGEVVVYNDSRLSGNVTVEAELVGESANTWKLLAYSLTSDAFVGSEGTLFSLRLKADDTFAEAADMTVDDVRVSVANGTSYVITKADSPLTATLMPIPEGDVNGDGKVNIFDVNAVYKAMADEAELPNHADVNGDGRINIFDVNTVYKMMAE